MFLITAYGKVEDPGKKAKERPMKMWDLETKRNLLVHAVHTSYSFSQTIPHLAPLFLTNKILN